VNLIQIALIGKNHVKQIKESHSAAGGPTLGSLPFANGTPEGRPLKATCTQRHFGFAGLDGDQGEATSCRLEALVRWRMSFGDMR
jgi:hypothetical protein